MRKQVTIETIVFLAALLIVIFGGKTFARLVQEDLARRYQQIATQKYYPPATLGEVDTYQWSFRNGEGTATLMLDADLPLARVIKNAKRIRVTVEVVSDNELEILGR